MIDALVEHGVEVLVDVRQTPISRKRGFSKRVLATALAERSIDYLHLPTLGNPKDNRDAFHRDDAALARGRDARHCHRGCITDLAHQEHPEISILPL